MRQERAVGSRDSWAQALLHATPVCLCILALFYYWFGVADRYAVFLYEHLGATPFDPMTSGRYWMAGLVACGVVMIGYTAINWVVKRVISTYRLPRWQQVWGGALLPLVIGIPLITMNLNQPVLPLRLAAACTVATLVSLAVALSFASLVVHAGGGALWLLLYGAGLMPPLRLIPALELPGRGVAVSPFVAQGAAIGGVIVGAGWLLLMTRLCPGRQPRSMSWTDVFLTGLALSYLLMSVVHHLFFTPPGYKYISASGNFFAHNIVLQLAAFAIAAMLSWGTMRLMSRHSSDARAA
ncbi:MAG: hypothetical protein CL878_12815 [Dehalococcoidia bacterium]|nr:hypothetical protein [Dehalococcoidia bacterium]